MTIPRLTAAAYALLATSLINVVYKPGDRQVQLLAGLSIAIAAVTLLAIVSTRGRAILTKPLVLAATWAALAILVIATVLT
jgi:hypothetical protein